MICPKCGSDDLRFRNYDSYTDEFVYVCHDCESIVRECDNETTYTNKSITADKITINDMQYDDYRVYNVGSRCPKCGSVMMLQTNGSFVCPKCKTCSLYTTKDSKMTVSKSLLPNEVEIIAEKITIVDKTIGIQIDISKQILDNIDSIVINGVKYAKDEIK